MSCRTRTCRTRTLSAGLALSLVLAWGSAACTGEGEGERPSILLVSIDMLRPDHLGCYGYTRNTSPTIDRLARAGVVFENAFVTTPICAASRATAACPT